MSRALAKWLAKYSEMLTPAQKEAAKAYAHAGKENYRVADTQQLLSKMAPKQAKDIEWLYLPELQQTLDQARRTRQDLMNSFGPDQEFISKRDPRLLEFLGGLLDEEVAAELGKPGRLSSQYFLKE